MIRRTFSVIAGGASGVILALILVSAGCSGSGDSPFAAKSGDGSAEPFGGLGDEVSFKGFRFRPPKDLPRREVPSPAPSITSLEWTEDHQSTARNPSAGLLVAHGPHMLDLTKEPPNWEGSAKGGLDAFRKVFKEVKQVAGTRLRINGLEAYRTEFTGITANSKEVAGVATVFLDENNLLMCIAMGLGTNAGDAAASLEESIMTVEKPGYVPSEDLFWDTPPGAQPGQPINKVHLEMIREYGMDKIAVVSVVDLPFEVTPSQKRHISKEIRETVGPEALGFGNIGPGDFVVVVAPVEDVAKLAGDLDLGQVTSVDQDNHSFTLHMDSDKLPSFMELAAKESGVPAADFGGRPGMPSRSTPVTSPDDPNFFKQNLADLRVEDMFRREKALNRLVNADTSKLTDSEIRKEIAQAIRAIAFDDSVTPKTRCSAIRGLVHWGGKFAGPLLVQLLREDEPFLEEEIYRQLAVVKEPSAIDPLVEKLMEFDSEDAAKCLEAFGPAAEDAVLANTRPDNFINTRTIVRLLAKIGTKKSLPALQSLRKLHFFPMISRDVQSAIQAIEQREKAAPKPPE